MRLPGLRRWISTVWCAWHADWLYRHLNNTSFTDATGKACRVRIYYDKTAPGVSDWKQLHFPSLQTSQAIILVCTPGIAIDFSKRGQPDWVYEELRWWCGHRDTAPIVVDTTGEGDRWLPQPITLKWPDINRIDLNKDDAEAAENTSRDFAQRIRERITDSIRESERRTVFEDLQRFKRLTKRLSVALSCAVFLLFVAVITTVWALKASERAEQQRKLAEEQRAVAEEQREQADHILAGATKIIRQLREETDINTKKEILGVFKSGADHGDATSMASLGWLYYNGSGVTQDYAKAREWFEKAADEGNAEAKANLEKLPIMEANGAGRYAEALQLQETLAARVEAVETERAGKPGEETEQALISVTWYALLAREFTKALTVADRAHALLPDDLSIETNRAHAL